MKLEVKNCTKKYADTIALQYCSFILTPGIYALLGPNGSGKSTLMNLIATLLTPEEGTILWNGKSIYKEKDYLSHLGYMPQYPSLYENFTLFEYLNYMGNIKGMKKQKVLERITLLCEEVELSHVLTHKLSSFSGGMKQRAMLAQALLNDPDILILDEPTAGLDPLKRLEIQNLISQLSKDKIILFATHVVSDVEFIAKEFLLLKKGKLLYQATRSELCQLLLGYVSEREVKEEEYIALNKEHRVSLVHMEQDKMIARLINKEKVATDEISPSLNDVYLYLFHDELNDDL